MRFFVNIFNEKSTIFYMNIENSSDVGVPMSLC